MPVAILITPKSDFSIHISCKNKAFHCCGACNRRHRDGCQLDHPLCFFFNEPEKGPTFRRIQCFPRNMVKRKVFWRNIDRIIAHQIIQQTEFQYVNMWHHNSICNTVNRIVNINLNVHENCNHRRNGLNRLECK